jgi:hypothetical protein
VPVNDFPYSRLKPAETASTAKDICAVISAVPQISENLKTLTDEISVKILELEARSFAEGTEPLVATGCRSRSGT